MQKIERHAKKQYKFFLALNLLKGYKSRLWLVIVKRLFETITITFVAAGASEAGLPGIISPHYAGHGNFYFCGKARERLERPGRKISSAHKATNWSLWNSSPEHKRRRASRGKTFAILATKCANGFRLETENSVVELFELWHRFLWCLHVFLLCL